MEIEPYTIDELVPIINGDGYAPNRKGRELIHLFNRYGARDVYDEFGLPDIGKKKWTTPIKKGIYKVSASKIVRKS